MKDFFAPTPPPSGDARLDREHRDLMNCVRDFERVRHEGDGHDGAVQALQFLLHHALTHFQSEEERMASLDYPDLAAHRAEHESLLNEARGWVERFHRKTVPADGVGGFITERILGHLNGGDRRFAEWMQRRSANGVPHHDVKG
jgi:hemerythrin